MADDVSVDGRTLTWADTGEPVKAGELHAGEMIVFDTEGRVHRGVGERADALAAWARFLDDAPGCILKAKVIEPYRDDDAPLCFDTPRAKDWEQRRYQKPKRRRAKR